MFLEELQNNNVFENSNMMISYDETLQPFINKNFDDSID